MREVPAPSSSRTRVPHVNLQNILYVMLNLPYERFARGHTRWPNCSASRAKE